MNTLNSLYQLKNNNEQVAKQNKLTNQSITRTLLLGLSLW
jgi:hypothetical protein